MKPTMLNLRRAAAVALTAAAIAAGLSCAYRMLRNNASNYKYDPFLKNKTDYDVLFYGSSHVINGVFPMQLSNDWGITSYNLSMHGCYTVTSCELLQLSLDYKKPKIAVLDVFQIQQGADFTQPGNMHKTFDAFPLSVHKIQAMREATAGRDDIGIAELLNPFSLYHSRWNEKGITTAALFDTARNRELGAESRISVATPNTVRRVQPDDTFDGGLPWLERFIRYCQERDIVPLLVFIPYPAPEYHQRVAHAAEAVARQYGVPFVNLFDADVVNLSTDCYDAGSHLNPSGARKVTDYLGRYLRTQMGVPDHRADAAYKPQWNGWYAAYKDLLAQNLKNQGSLKNVLMLLNNENFAATVSVSDRYQFDAVERQLLDQVRDTCAVTSTTFARNGNCDVVVTVRDSTTGQTVHTVIFNKDQSGVLKKFDMDANKKATAEARQQYRSTARLDIKDSGSEQNAVQVVRSSSKSALTQVNWYTNEQGAGYTLHSDEKRVDLTLRCVGDGEFLLTLRGLDWRDRLGVRVPLKVRYTACTVNGADVLGGAQTLWHDKPMHYSQPVRDGDIITIHAEWTEASD